MNRLLHHSTLVAIGLLVSSMLVLVIGHVPLRPDTHEVIA